jgi:type IV pilus assembly protein PilQ
MLFNFNTAITHVNGGASVALKRITAISLLLAVVFSCFASWPAAAQGGSSEYITIKARKIDITDVLKMIVDFTGINIIHEKSVKGPLTLTLKDVYYEKALELICKTNGYAYRKIGNTYVVASEKKLSEAFDIGLNKTYRLQFSKAAEMEKILKGVFKQTDAKVDVSIDNRINAVICSGTQATLDQVSKLIKNIDVPVHQVMIEAKIVEVSTSGMRDIGFNWSWGTNGESSDSGDFMVINENLAPVANADKYNPEVGPSGPIFELGDFFRDRLFVKATLDALERCGDSKVLSNPKVSALNGETANIIVGQKVIYGGTSDSPPQEKDVGVKLKVTPQINDDGYITADVEPEVSFVSAYVQGIPRIEQRNAKTRVRVKDGEEILIGGLISENDTYNNEKLPILGNIPLLKSLFTRTTKDRTNSELIILITPHIMRRSEIGE